MTEQTEVKIDTVVEVEPAVKLNLYQKISAVMQEVDYLQKDGNIEFKSTKYKAISEEKVTTAVRQALIKYGLVILPIEQEHSREGTLTTVNTKYKIVDTNTGQHEIIVSSGTGADTQDKGVGKAMTYSYKYLLLRTFAIPTGEDPDRISSAELDEKSQSENTNNQSNKQQNQSNKPLATDKQLNLVTKLLKEVAAHHNISEQEANKILKDRFQKEMEWYTVEDASKAITLLKSSLEK